jgi:hypothetical protein
MNEIYTVVTLLSRKKSSLGKSFNQTIKTAGYINIFPFSQNLGGKLIFTLIHLTPIFNILTEKLTVLENNTPVSGHCFE